MGVVLIERRDDGIALVINRPNKRNALNDEVRRVNC